MHRSASIPRWGCLRCFPDPLADGKGMPSQYLGGLRNYHSYVHWAIVRATPTDLGLVICTKGRKVPKSKVALNSPFLLRCIECRRSLAIRKLSVRLSVKRVNCDKTEERSVQIFIPYERLFSLVFWEEEWLVGATPSTWNFESKWPRWSEIADFRSLRAVTPSEKTSINTNRKSTMRFPMSSRWTSYVVSKPPPKGWLKNAKCSKFEQ